MPGSGQARDGEAKTHTRIDVIFLEPSQDLHHAIRLPILFGIQPIRLDPSMASQTVAEAVIQISEEGKTTPGTFFHRF